MHFSTEKERRGGGEENGKGEGGGVSLILPEG